MGVTEADGITDSRVRGVREGSCFGILRCKGLSRPWLRAACLLVGRAY